MRNLIIKLLFLILFVSSALVSLAQEPTDQDCLGAITVCQSIYTQSNSYSGTGNYPNEIPTTGGCPGNCLTSGEKNDVWYIFTVNSGGNLGFKISPNDLGDDYDWAVYSLNTFDCEDIFSHTAQMQVSCNYSGNPGVTGAMSLTQNNCAYSTANNTNKNGFIPVVEGETYVLNISNYSSSQSGYTLDFGLSTANIYDDVSPEISAIFANDLQCGSTELEFDFTERVLCNSVQPSDFSLTGPGGPYTVTDVYGTTCQQGGEAENHYTLVFNPPIYESGDYSLNVLSFSFIKDDCGNTSPVQSYPFIVDLNSPTADAGEDIDISYGTNTMLDGEVSGGSGSFNFDWQPEDKLVDNTVEDPTTVNLIETTNYTMMVEDPSNNCRSTDDVTVNIVGGAMSVTLITDQQSVCSGNATEINAVPSGGAGTDIEFKPRLGKFSQLSVKVKVGLIAPSEHNQILRQFIDQFRVMDNNIAPRHHDFAALHDLLMDFEQEVEIDLTAAPLLHQGFAAPLPQVVGLVTERHFVHLAEHLMERVFRHPHEGKDDHA